MNKLSKKMIVIMFISIAIVLNIIENSFIPELPYGIRFGLANVIALITINCYTEKEMVIVNILRVVIASILCSTIFSTRFFIGLGGIVLSSISLMITRIMNSSVLFSSILSSIFHTIGQIIIVCIIYNTKYMLAILPIYILSSVATGIITGEIAKQVLKRVRI